MERNIHHKPELVSPIDSFQDYMKGYVAQFVSCKYVMAYIHVYIYMNIYIYIYNMYAYAKPILNITGFISRRYFTLLGQLLSPK